MYFKSRERTSRTHGFQLHISKPKDAIRGLQANSFYFRTAKIWNNLPKDVVDAKNINHFKKMLGEHWNHDPLKFDHSRIQNDASRLTASQPANCKSLIIIIIIIIIMGFKLSELLLRTIFYIDIFVYINFLIHAHGRHRCHWILTILKFIIISYCWNSKNA